MYTRWAGATGRYQGKCEQGHCALTGDQATSKHEGEIRTLLKYVIGHGRGDVKVPSGRRQFRLDMVFDLPSGLVLVAEYDGAYWHGGRNQEERRHNEERDYYKAPGRSRQRGGTEDAPWSASGKTPSNRFIIMTSRRPPAAIPRPARRRC
jgi:hypothetical protein